MVPLPTALLPDLTQCAPPLLLEPPTAWVRRTPFVFLGPPPKKAKRSCGKFGAAPRVAWRFGSTPREERVERSLFEGSFVRNLGGGNGGVEATGPGRTLEDAS